ncbi:MAG: flagellar hook-basal body complex protein [Lachnospiraceae bacterium]|nr:flagellar hook-basal body complex protein [Lachnospiraceae bacterium]
MVRSMFAGVAGLRTHQSKLDVIGNNIANVNTWGFKAGAANFMDSLYTNSTNSTGGNTGQAGGQGGNNASQVGYGVQMSSISRDFSKSTPYLTGKEMDVMIDGTGFLIVSNSPGNDDPIEAGANGSIDLKNAPIGLKLSRVGILGVDNEGYLVDNQKSYIYGYTTTDNGETFSDEGAAQSINRLKIPAPDATNIAGFVADPKEIGSNGKLILKNYKIMSDGTVVGFTSVTEQKITLGKIALANVQNVDGLESESGYYYQMGENAGDCTAAASNGILGSFLSGYLEMPNVDLAKEFSEMITTQRGFQANTKVITVTDEMLQELVNMKR